MSRFFISAALGAALALSSATGALAAVDTGVANSLISSLSSLPASAERNGLIAQIQSLSGACAGGSSSACVVALQNVVAAAQALNLPSNLASEVASLTRETAANTPGVTTDPNYVTLSSNVDTLSPTTPTGATGAPAGGAPAGGGAAAGGGSPGGGGGSFGPDSAASAGAAG